MMFNFVLWKWRQNGFRSRYTFDHVNTMARMIKRYCPEPHRIICVTDDRDGIDPGLVTPFPLWDDHKAMRNASGVHLPSCYRRLKLFDRKTQEALGIEPNQRAVSLDLDAVLLDDLGPLLRREEMFVGWGVPGTRHKMVFNGSMWMFNSGDQYQWMWDGFDPLKSPHRALNGGFFGSDQGYISEQLVYAREAGNWTAEKDGVLSYARDVRAIRVLPKHARIVMFHGKRKPWDPITRRESRWIERYYK